MALCPTIKALVILEKIIQRHKECIDNKVEEYMSFLEQSDTQEESGDPQISTTVEDARTLLVQGQVVEVSYNIQTAVDHKHKLIRIFRTLHPQGGHYRTSNTID